MVTSLHVPDIVLMTREREAVIDGLVTVGKHMSSSLFTYLEEEEEEVMVMVGWAHLLGSREENGYQLM